MTEKNISGIANADRPNAGRMYDYFLGGNHNFEVDRQAAQQVLEISPFMPKLMRLIRWFLGTAVRNLVDDGYRQFLDFASGLPTMDHIHLLAPEGSKIIYSDIDPVTVAYAKEIIGDNSNVQYVQCDAAQPEQLLNSGKVEEVFGNRDKIAIGFNGIAYFLTDEEFKHAMEVIYEWAEPGDKLFLCENDATKITADAKKVLDIYEQVGQPLYIRSLDEVKEITSMWKVTEPGFLPLDEWQKMAPSSFSDIMDTEWGARIFGVILEK